MSNFASELIAALQNNPIGIHGYLLVSAALFFFGLSAVLTRSNAIGTLIGIELMLNAAIINFMAFWHFGTAAQDLAQGPLAGVFIIVLAACEAAIALAILLNLYFNAGTVEIDSVHSMER